MSHEIKCPHCSETLSLDDAGYAEIQNQVRTKEFGITGYFWGPEGLSKDFLKSLEEEFGVGHAA
jgi:hypothetical protein